MLFKPVIQQLTQSLKTNGSSEILPVIRVSKRGQTSETDSIFADVRSHEAHVLSSWFACSVIVVVVLNHCITCEGNKECSVVFLSFAFLTTSELNKFIIKRQSPVASLDRQLNKTDQLLLSSNVIKIPKFKLSIRQG